MLSVLIRIASPLQFIKTYVVGSHKNRLGEAILVSTHNICFSGLGDSNEHPQKK